MKSFAGYRIELPYNAAGEVYTTCPECSQSRKKKLAKCLSVNVEKEVWVCHHCGWKGGLLAGPDRIRSEHWAKPKYIKPSPEKACQIEIPRKTLDWFLARGITENVVARNRIIRGEVYMPQVEEIVPAIGFPFYRNGELINIKWRDAHKNFRQEAGCEQVLFGLDDVADQERWIWVEGEMDKLALEVAGYKNVVSVPNGAPTPDTKEYSSKFDFLQSAADLIAKAKQHVIAVDNDGPGKALERELSRRLGRERCAVVEWPEGIKDANECLVKLGPGYVMSFIGMAKPYPVEGSVEYSEKIDAVSRLYEYGMEPGLGVGWECANEFYTVKPGEMTVITGIPNSGKSNWLDALTVNMARKYGWKFAVFSPENQPVEAHIARMTEKYLFKPFANGPTRRMTRDELSDAVMFLNEHFTAILPPHAELCTLDGLLDIARQLVLLKGIKGLVIDPWNEVEHDRPQGMTETEYVSVCLGKVRRFARGYGVHVWMVAHPQKLQKDKDGNYPIPTPYDIAGSAHWRNKADNCITVWRDFNDKNGLISIHVQKVRFRENGKIGEFQLKYDRPTGCYIDMTTGAHCV